MNAADMALAQGFAALTATAGNEVTFRGRAMSAVIDWRPFDERNPDNGCRHVGSGGRRNHPHRLGKSPRPEGFREWLGMGLRL